MLNNMLLAAFCAVYGGLWAYIAVCKFTDDQPMSGSWFIGLKTIKFQHSQRKRYVILSISAAYSLAPWILMAVTQGRPGFQAASDYLIGFFPIGWLLIPIILSGLIWPIFSIWGFLFIWSEPCKVAYYHRDERMPCDEVFEDRFVRIPGGWVMMNDLYRRTSKLPLYQIKPRYNEQAEKDELAFVPTGRVLHAEDYE